MAVTVPSVYLPSYLCPPQSWSVKSNQQSNGVKLLDENHEAVKLTPALRMHNDTIEKMPTNAGIGTAGID